MSGERVNTRTALLWPAYDPREERSFAVLPGRPPTAITAGALQLRPGGARVLIEHEDNRPAGYVRELFRIPWPDGVWHAALLELDDDWPGRRGVSISVVPLAETALLDGRRIIQRGVVHEVSITAAPAIARAQLLPASAVRAAPVAQPHVLRRPCGRILAIR